MRYYIVSWDCEGVEFFEEITEHHPDNWAKNHLFDSIKASKTVGKALGLQPHELEAQGAGQHAPALRDLRVHQRRGYRCQRSVSGSRTEPQGFADWVRQNHSYKIWDDRATKKPAIV
jgi:hypothetical protein